MLRVADYIIKALVDAGINTIFMVTGRGILYLTDAVARNEDMEAVSSYHEQGASYAAMAYAKVKGIGACLVSTGCAATNAITAALCAFQDNLPVVFISGNNMLEENTGYTGIPIRTYGSQETDIVKIVGSVTKYAVMLTDKETVTYEMEKALHIASTGRKGPVWIDVPLDVQNMRIDMDTQRHFAPETKIPAPCKKDIMTVVRNFETATRPILLIGGGAKAASREVKELAERYNIPVAFSPSAADVYGTFNRLSIGAVGSIGGSRAGNFSVQNADFILAVGTKLCTQETGMKHKFAREGKIVVIDIDEQEHRKKSVHIDAVIHADAKEFLGGLLEQGIKEGIEEWVGKCRHWKELFSVGNEEFIKELKSRDELDIYSMADILNDVLPDNATIITDAGFEELIVPSTIKFKEQQQCLFPASQGAMGYAIPAIMGAYFAGRKNIICIIGDGSFMMNMQELQIVMAQGIKAKIFVVNNNMYAVIRKRQKDLFKNRTVGNDPSDGVPAPDFEKIADCFGWSYRRVNALKEWEQISREVVGLNEAVICEVKCVPDQSYLHESYAINENRKLVHRPIEDMAPFLSRELIRNEMIVEMMEEK